MSEVVRKIYDPSGKRLVEITQNPDGTFTFDEFFFDEAEKAFCFVKHPRQDYSVSRTATIEEALAEAKGRIAWLSEIADVER